MRMKLLLVITHGNMGGATNVVYELARGLRAEGADVAVGFGEGEYLAGKLAALGVPVHRFSSLKRSRNPLRPWLFAREMRAFVAAEHFDAVQFNSTNALPGCLGAKLADKRVRTIFTFHGLSVLDQNYRTFFLLKWAYRLFFRLFLPYVDVPVFVSENDLGEAERMGIVKGGSVIYNGMDASALSFASRGAAREFIAGRIGRDLASAFLIGSIGRPSYQKNYEFLVQAMPDILKAIPGAIAVVMGDGPRRIACEVLAAKLGVAERVFFPGEVSDAPRYLKAFDLFALTSRYEGLPVTLVECLFANVPVLVPDIGGDREVAGSESLYLLGDRPTFVEKIVAAKNNPARLLPKKDTAPQFSGRLMAEEYLAVAAAPRQQ